MKIGFVGMGAMGLPMALQLVQESGHEVYGFDVVDKQKELLRDEGGIPVNEQEDIYKSCSVIFQSLPTHPIIENSFRMAAELCPKGTIIVDLSSTAPDIILKWHEKLEDAGIALLDAPVSGGVVKAAAGDLAIMAGGDKDVYEKVLPLLQCFGKPVYTGGPSTGSTTKLVNNIMGGGYLIAMAEAYAFAAKVGLDLENVFEATREGFVGGPLYEDKIPKLLKRDFEPGGRVAVHRKDIINAKQYAHQMGIDLPLSDVVLMIMDWMTDHGDQNEDQIAMVKYYEDKMKVKVVRDSEDACGSEENENGERV